jgi:hypothetical protein
MREHNRQTLTVHPVPPFKSKERVGTLDRGCFALLGVCVGVNQLLGGTSPSEALRALFQQFERRSRPVSA